MDSNKDINLNSAEIGSLWTAYMNDSMAVCTVRYFIETVEDEDIKPLLKQALSQCQQYIQQLRQIFSQGGVPIPEGFGTSDFDLSAPKLFTDRFILFYLRFMERIGLNAYSTALPYMKRKETRDFVSQCITDCVDLTNKVSEVFLKKGIFPTAPYISIVNNTDVVKDRSFIKGLVGEKRSLTAIEISELFDHIMSNYNAKILVTGFSQVADSKAVRNHMLKGKEITSKHIDIYSDILSKDDVPVPTPSDSGVTDSTISPFSDRLMLHHINTIASFGISTDGLSISNSMRPDLTATYTRFMAEVLQYVAGGIKLMIDNEWMEQPPQAIDHKLLAKTR